MDLLPTTLGIRPRLAVEIRPEGVMAARSEDAEALLSAVSFGPLAAGAVAPGLKAGNLPRRSAVVTAVRKALESVMLKERQTTLVLPDSAARVLLLDFDALPAKAFEALPVVRFRLKKLLPFDPDDAVVSYQVMSSTRNLVRVVAVAVPREVLSEYESVVREAGFEPGAVLPSTLAALSGLDDDGGAVLVVNAGESSVTTAIVEENVLLLHRMVDFAAEGVELTPATDVAATIPSIPMELPAVPLVDRESTEAEWTMQQPVEGYGVLADDPISAAADEQARRLARKIEEEAYRDAARDYVPVKPKVSGAVREVTQAISVAAAYFEDTLGRSPGVFLSSGSLGASELRGLLGEAGLYQDEIRVREMVDAELLTAGATTSLVPLGWLAGVRGALRS